MPKKMNKLELRGIELEHFIERVGRKVRRNLAKERGELGLYCRPSMFPEHREWYAVYSSCGIVFRFALKLMNQGAFVVAWQTSTSLQHVVKKIIKEPSYERARQLIEEASGMGDTSALILEYLAIGSGHNFRNYTSTHGNEWKRKHGIPLKSHKKKKSRKVGRLIALAEAHA